MKGKELKELVAGLKDDGDYICEITEIGRFSDFTRLKKIVSSKEFIITDNESFVGEFDEYE